MILPLHPLTVQRTDRPVLVWLHGLLGDHQEWTALKPYFIDWPCVAVDLPGHGAAAQHRVSGFESLSHRLQVTLQAHAIHRYCLIGYSLGGRIALYHACQPQTRGCCGLILEGAHPGLPNSVEQQARIEHDHCWAERFRYQELVSVLRDWYQQPVFADLSDAQRDHLIERRRHNDPQGVADMLEATSLGCQPSLAVASQQLTFPMLFVCGEHDHKFSDLAQHVSWPLRHIPKAGHNAHVANPAGFADALLPFLTHHFT